MTRKTSVERITLEEFRKRVDAQGVPIEHAAFVCPVCSTVQSATSLIRVRAGKSLVEVEGYLAFSCVGRWTHAGPWQPGDPPGKGCDWTLGGLFTIHKLEVGDTNRPCFEFATREQAQELMQAATAENPEATTTA